MEGYPYKNRSEDLSVRKMHSVGRVTFDQLGLRLGEEFVAIFNKALLDKFLEIRYPDFNSRARYGLFRRDSGLDGDIKEEKIEQNNRELVFFRSDFVERFGLYLISKCPKHLKADLSYESEEGLEPLVSYFVGVISQMTQRDVEEFVGLIYSFSDQKIEKLHVSVINSFESRIHNETDELYGAILKLTEKFRKSVAVAFNPTKLGISVAEFCDQMNISIDHYLSGRYGNVIIESSALVTFLLKNKERFKAIAALDAFLAEHTEYKVKDSDYLPVFIEGKLYAQISQTNVHGNPLAGVDQEILEDLEESLVDEIDKTTNERMFKKKVIDTIHTILFSRNNPNLGIYFHPDENSDFDLVPIDVALDRLNNFVNALEANAFPNIELKGEVEKLQKNEEYDAIALALFEEEVDYIVYNCGGNLVFEFDGMKYAKSHETDDFWHFYVFFNKKNVGMKHLSKDFNRSLESEDLPLGNYPKILLREYLFNIFPDNEQYQVFLDLVVGFTPANIRRGVLNRMLIHYDVPTYDFSRGINNLIENVSIEGIRQYNDKIDPLDFIVSRTGISLKLLSEYVDLDGQSPEKVSLAELLQSDFDAESVQAKYEESMSALDVFAEIQDSYISYAEEMYPDIELIYKDSDYVLLPESLEIQAILALIPGYLDDIIQNTSFDISETEKATFIESYSAKPGDTFESILRRLLLLPESWAKGDPLETRSILVTEYMNEVSSIRTSLVRLGPDTFKLLNDIYNDSVNNTVDSVINKYLQQVEYNSATRSEKENFEKLLTVLAFVRGKTAKSKNKLMEFYKVAVDYGVATMITGLLETEKVLQYLKLLGVRLELKEKNYEFTQVDNNYDVAGIFNDTLKHGDRGLMARLSTISDVSNLKS